MIRARLSAVATIPVGAHMTNGSHLATKKPTLSLIVTHAHCHLDERAAIWMLRRFGTRRYAFQNGPPSVYYAASEDEAREVIERRDDAVAVGVLGGEFDEHKADGRLHGICANDLVAKGLRVSRLQNLRIILREVNRADTEAGQRHFELGQMLKTALQYGSFSDDELTAFVGKFLDAEYEKAREFNEDCPRDLRTHGRIETLSGIPVALVQSDLPSIGAYARTMKGARLVAIQRSTGNIQIFSQVTHKGFVPLVAREILRAENWLAGRDPSEREADEVELQKIIDSGKGRELPGAAGHWYYHLEAGAILNGSLSHAVTPTTLDLDLLEAIVERGINAAVASGAMYIVGPSPEPEA